MVELHITVNSVIIFSVAQILLWRIHVAGNIKTYLGFHVECHFFFIFYFFNFNKVWIFWTGFRKSSQY